jgi:hypothetical protein
VFDAIGAVAPYLKVAWRNRHTFAENLVTHCPKCCFLSFYTIRLIDTFCRSRANKRWRSQLRFTKNQAAGSGDGGDKVVRFGRNFAIRFLAG